MNSQNCLAPDKIMPLDSLLEVLIGLSRININGNESFDWVNGAGDNFALALYERSGIYKPNISSVELVAVNTDDSITRLVMRISTKCIRAWRGQDV